jgi:esterase/lipase superfamily enzyme
MVDKPIFFATNRMPVGTPTITSFDNTLSMVGGQDLRFGRATMSVEGKKITMKRLDVAPESTAVKAPGSDATFGSQRVFKEIGALPAGDMVVLVHGFGNTFAEALQGAAELSVGLDKHVFLYTWASCGIVSGNKYREDRDSRAEPSGRALARVLDIFIRWLDELRRQRQRCDRRLHLVAHSMGNLVLQHAITTLQQQRAAGVERPAVIDQVLLAASDVDANALANEMRPLASAARAITVYHTKSDGALTISDEYKGNTTRLGHGGPANMRVLFENVFAVDVTPTVDRFRNGPPDNDPVNHWFIRRTRAVMDDAIQVLAGADQTTISGRLPDPATPRRFTLVGAAT